MSIFTRDNTDVAFEAEDGGRQHRGVDGGMIVALEHWKAGLDTGEMFADLPDGACQEPHWGYIIQGQVTMRYTDGRSEALSAGHAYYIPPGHNAHVDEDVDLVEFTRDDQTEGIHTVVSED